MEKTHYRAYLSALSAMAIWSLTFVFFKIANRTCPPFTIVFLRLLMASVFLVVVAIVTRRFERIRRKDTGLFIILALVNPFLYFIAESTGLTLISATLTAVIVSTIPLFVPVGAWLFFRERMTLLNVTGLIISFAGVMVVIVERDLTFRASIPGVLIMFGAVLLAVSYTLLAKRLVRDYNSFTIVTCQNIVGTVLMVPLVLLFDLHKLKGISFDAASVSSIVYLAVFGSSLAFILFNNSIRLIGAAKTDAFTNIIPVLTAVFAYLVLNEAIDLKKVTGIAIVLSGLFLSQLRPRYKI